MINIFETSFEARERRFQIEKLYHGETVDLVGVVTTNGVPQNITGYAVSGVFQPTSMNGSPDFYELSADIVENKVIVHWEKGKDFGENSYMVWALLTDGDNASYPIAWRLDMAYSPSYPLSSLAPIPKAIDFSKYDLLNAPWLPLSGGTVTGALSVTGTFESSNFKGDAGKGIMIGYNAKANSGSIAIGSSSDVTNAHFGSSNVAVGTSAKIGSTSETDCAVAIGIGATVNGNYGIAIGHAAGAEGANSIAIGSSGSRVQALAPESIQIGGLSNGLWTPNNTPHSLKVFDKMVLSGDNLTLDPERVPYLSNYETKEDAATEHQTLSADLTAYVDEKISEIPTPEPPPVAGVLTIKQNESVVVEYNPDDSEDLTATITVPEDLSAFTNSPGYATSAYVQEYVDEHGGGSAEGMSACLSSDEFGLVAFLSYDENGAALSTNSITDIGNKINSLIALLKRVDDPHASYYRRLTKIRYTDGTEQTLDIVGQINSSNVPNINSVSAIVIGTDVTSLANSLFANKMSLQEVSIPGTVGTISQQAFYFQYPNNISKAVSAMTLNEGTTTIANQAFYGCNFAQITIPSTVTSIGTHAFSYNHSLTSLNIPAAVTSIGASIAAGDYKMSSINVDESNNNYKSYDGILLTKNGENCLVVPTGKGGAIVIPEGVTTIGDGACADLSNCTSLSLPSTLTTIGYGAIGGSSSGWTTLTVPSSVTSIGQYAFSYLAGKTLTFEGKTKTQVQTMSNYPWDVKSGSGTKFVCTDGTITR